LLLVGEVVVRLLHPITTVLQVVAQEDTGLVQAFPYLRERLILLL
jgi:hypothetical protein